MKSFLIAAFIAAVIAENFYFRIALKRVLQTRFNGAAKVTTADWLNVQSAVIHLMHKADLRFRDIALFKSNLSERADVMLDQSEHWLEHSKLKLEDEAVKVDAEVTSLL